MDCVLRLLNCRIGTQQTASQDTYVVINLYTPHKVLKDEVFKWLVLCRKQALLLIAAGRL